jgi:hypothetical protein
MFEYLSSSGVVAAALIAPPGPEVIAALSTLPMASLSPEAEVDALIAWERQAEWVAARMQPVLARVGDVAESAVPRDPWAPDAGEMPIRAAHAEIGAALRLSGVTAAGRLDTARELRRLPMVQAALEGGKTVDDHRWLVLVRAYFCRPAA